MPRDVVNFTQLLYVIRMLKGPLMLLIRGLIVAVSVVPSVLTIALVSCVNLVIIFFLEVPLPRDSRSHARTSKASIHTLMTVRRLVTIFGFFMAISSIVLMSLTPSRKALMISISWMYRIAFLLL
jgi:hypothetical protein